MSQDHSADLEGIKGEKPSLLVQIRGIKRPKLVEVLKLGTLQGKYNVLVGQGWQLKRNRLADPVDALFYSVNKLRTWNINILFPGLFGPMGRQNMLLLLESAFQINGDV